MTGYYFLSEITHSKRFDDAVNATSADPFVRGDWFQLAKTGVFYSPEYGKFSITSKDLATMYRNFKTITPVAPTQLPIDYDHFSDDPEAHNPGDAKASGWVLDLQLRAGGDELWCLPKWTKPAARLIANGEYRFVSPFFMTNYLDKASGKKVGPTLKAVAITNRPFLEGMQEIPAPHIAASESIARQFKSRVAVSVRAASSRSSAHHPRRSTRMAKDNTSVAACEGTEMGDKPGSAHSLTCPHCGAPVKHASASAHDAELDDLPNESTIPMGEDGDVDGGEEMTEPIGPAEGESDGEIDADGDSDGTDEDELETATTSKGGTPGTRQPGKRADSVGMSDADVKAMTPAERRMYRMVQSLSEQVRTSNARSADYERMLRGVQATNRRAMAEKLIEQGRRAGKLTPRMIGTAAKPGWALSEAQRNPKRFQKWLGTAPRVVALGEIGTSQETAADAASGTAEKIRQLTEAKKLAKPTIGHSQALREVLSENRALAESYDREMIGERQSPNAPTRSNVRRL